ncbi:hypothetical protein C2G38_2049087 [Gigaspora rosea]|uniref:Uncharacterized protein n=1 Tax=Gigaspora rosea TaxID=44941 RepID=A0A397U4I1_9GLOM|nr:hypothetical protein C2G38_2049087 [Gigaspora rosea]
MTGSEISENQEFQQKNLPGNARLPPSTMLKDLSTFVGWYQEKPSVQANLTEAQPHILQIAHYNDNSRLLLRVIQPNGSVIPINFEYVDMIQDRGLIFDWDGMIISKLEFGPSYLFPGTNWYPNEFIVNNITPKNGFLRLSVANDNETDSLIWRQYKYNLIGRFDLFRNGTVPGLLDLPVKLLQLLL